MYAQGAVASGTFGVQGNRVTFQEEGQQVLEDEEYDNVNELAENEVGLQSS
jgi:hypothetical protein